jgi:hypothetical protein
MNTLPTTSTALRLNAFAAAAIVTLMMLAGIDHLATAESAAPHLAQVAATQPA